MKKKRRCFRIVLISITNIPSSVLRFIDNKSFTPTYLFSLTLNFESYNNKITLKNLIIEKIFDSKNLKIQFNMSALKLLRPWKRLLLKTFGIIVCIEAQSSKLNKRVKTQDIEVILGRSDQIRVKNSPSPPQTKSGSKIAPSDQIRVNNSPLRPNQGQE